MKRVARIAWVVLVAASAGGCSQTVETSATAYYVPPGQSVPITVSARWSAHP